MGVYFQLFPQVFYLECLFTLVQDKEQFTKEVHKTNI